MRFRVGHRYRDSVIWGYPAKPELRRVLDLEANEVDVPSSGVMLTTKLAEILGVEPGQ